MAAIHDSIDYEAATHVVHHAAADLAEMIDTDITSFVAFRRAWIRDLGRLARTHNENWVVGAYAVQTIRQLRGQMPIE